MFPPSPSTSLKTEPCSRQYSNQSLRNHKLKAMHCCSACIFELWTPSKKETTKGKHDRWGEVRCWSTAWPWYLHGWQVWLFDFTRTVPVSSSPSTRHQLLSTAPECLVHADSAQSLQWCLRRRIIWYYIYVHLWTDRSGPHRYYPPCLPLPLSPLHTVMYCLCLLLFVFFYGLWYGWPNPRLTTFASPPANVSMALSMPQPHLTESAEG